MPSASPTSLDQQVAQTGLLLERRNLRVVFAESCTGGLVAASLARLPGISRYLCGSAVTYRNLTKSQWLGISAGLLDRIGAVHEEVTREMAVSVLNRTPEADYSAAITGHLGPDAPAELDGLVFTAIARRAAEGLDHSIRLRRHRLRQRGRVVRQSEAVECVLSHLREAIELD